MIRSTTRRLLWAILIAALLALGIKAVNAQGRGGDAETQIVYYFPGLCASLEPYSYWWYFWACDLAQPGLAESVTYHFESDGRVFVEIIRTYPSGQRSSVIRELKER